MPDDRGAEGARVGHDGEFATDVLKLATASTFANALGILASPILTRIFSPAAFGVAGLFNSILGVAAIFAGFRYQQAIMIPKKEEEAASLLFFCCGLAALAGLLLVPVVWVWGSPLSELLNAPGLEPFLWLMPIAVLSSGLTVSFNQWFSRLREFGLLAKVRVAQSTLTTGSKLGLGFAQVTSAGSLIGSNVGASVLATAILGMRITRGQLEDTRGVFSVTRAAALAKRYRNFPIYNMPNAFLNTVSMQMPAFMLSAFFSPKTVGFYALAYSSLNLPMDLIGQAVGKVFYQRSSAALGEDRLAAVVKKTFLSLVVLGTMPILVVSIVGADLFAVVFGGEWSEAGVFAQILAPWSLAVFVGSPLSVLFNTLERQEMALKFNIVLFAARAVSLSLGGWMGNARLAILLFAFSGVSVWVWRLTWLLSSSGVRIGPLIRAVYLHLSLCSPFLLAVVAAKVFFGRQETPIVVAAVIIGIAFLLVASRFDPTLRDMSEAVRAGFRRNEKS